jgi:hypothetical protein
MSRCLWWFCYYLRSTLLNNHCIRIVKPTWCTFHSVCWESRASTCFEHHLLILRMLCPNGTWYIACVLCQPTIHWMKSSSRWFHFTEELWCTANRTLSLKVHCSFNTQIAGYVCKVRLCNRQSNNFWRCTVYSPTQSQPDITTAAGHLPYHFAKLYTNKRVELPLNPVRYK